jgi:hypothetical protein
MRAAARELVAPEGWDLMAAQAVALYRGERAIP